MSRYNNNTSISIPVPSKDEDDFELFGPIKPTPSDTASSQYDRCIQLCTQLENRIQQEDILAVPTATCSRQFKTKSTARAFNCKVAK